MGTKTIMYDRIVPPGGEFRPRTRVRVRLVAADSGEGTGYNSSDRRTIVGIADDLLDSELFVVDLDAQASISAPANTAYEIARVYPGWPAPPASTFTAPTEPTPTATTQSVTLPAANIAASTSGFASSGAIYLAGQLVTYTGTTPTAFTGCTGGSGLIPSGTAVRQAYWIASYLVSPPTGLPNLHVDNPAGAHAASAVAVAPTGGLVATTAQAALAELDGELAAEAALARNADNLTSGTVADARIAASIARDSEVSAAVAAEAALRETGDTVRIANQQVANYTLVLTDAGKAVEGNAAGALNFTVPPNSSVAYPTGTIIEVVQVGAGAVTLVPGSGVTITGDTATPGQGGSLLLRKTGTNAWFSAITSVRSDTFVHVARVAVNVKDFGAVGDGAARPLSATFATLAAAQAVYPDAVALTDDIDWAASMKAVTACMGPGTVLAGRQASRALYFPAGSYRFNRPLTNIKGVRGFHLFGDGKWLTRFLAVGHIDSLLAIDGSTNGVFEGFSCGDSGTGGGVDSVQSAVSLQWSGSATTAVSSTDNGFRDIRIADMSYVSGFAIGSTSGALQVDGTSLTDCVVSGGYVVGSANVTTYQAGYLFGSGTHGNVVDHYMYNCPWTGVRYGVHMNASNATVRSCQPGSADIDFYINSSGHPIVIDDIRTEGSQRLMVAAGGNSDSHISMSNVLYNAQALHTDGQWINIGRSGSFILDNVKCATPPAGVTPVVNAVSSGNDPLSVAARGVSSPTGIATAFSTGTATWLTAENYHQVNSADNTILASTPLYVKKGATVLVMVTPTAVDALDAGFSASLGYGYGFAGVGGAAGGLFASGNALVFRSRATGGIIYLQDSAGNTYATFQSSGVTLPGALDHDGTTVGFFGKVPATQPAAQADTTGATLAALETEVNGLKAKLRVLGLMA